MAYSSTEEILEAIKLLKEKKAENITEEKFNECLYGERNVNLDLLIRTSAEVRLSNFMLYQGMLNP